MLLKIMLLLMFTCYASGSYGVNLDAVSTHLQVVFFQIDIWANNEVVSHAATHKNICIPKVDTERK